MAEYLNTNSEKKLQILESFKAVLWVSSELLFNIFCENLTQEKKIREMGHRKKEFNFICLYTYQHFEIKTYSQII